MAQPLDGRIPGSHSGCMRSLARRCRPPVSEVPSRSETDSTVPGGVFFGRRRPTSISAVPPKSCAHCSMKAESRQSSRHCDVLRSEPAASINVAAVEPDTSRDPDGIPPQETVTGSRRAVARFGSRTTADYDQCGSCQRAQLDPADLSGAVSIRIDDTTRRGRFERGQAGRQNR